MFKFAELIPLPNVTAGAWAVYDAKAANGQMQLICGKKETDRREVASITKMMTFYTSYQIFKKYGASLPKGPLYHSNLPFWMDKSTK